MNTALIVPVLVGLAIGFIFGWVLRGNSSGNAAAPSFTPAAPAPVVGEHPEVETLIREGKLIEAIKLHRQRTCAGLKEAKDAVDALQRKIMRK